MNRSAVADPRVQFWIGLSAERCANQSGASLLQREPCAHNLRRLLARSRQDVGQSHGSALCGGTVRADANERAHRDGPRTHAHADSFADNVGPAHNEIEEKELREAEFGYVQDVARLR